MIREIGQKHGTREADEHRNPRSAVQVEDEMRQ